MKKTIIIFSSIWLFLVALSFVWDYENARDAQEEIALQTARSFFNQIITSRVWNAVHGGVYVPVTSDTQPNQYLDDPLRDIQVNESLMLTKINPALMTRQMAEIAAQRGGIQFHLTSLRPIRPDNEPTPREENALKAFERGKSEIGQIIDKGSQRSFFYMAPLETEKSCLDCHSKQGYKEGDIRGGISVILPFVAHIPVMGMITGHLVIGLIGLLGIAVSGMQLNKAYEVIKKQSVVDDLTGIYNRRFFSGQILTLFNSSKREKYPLSIIMGDIDDFKAYNDTYGHLRGDECLRQIAQIIEKTLKRPGDFCCRYGGEEFVIVLPYTTHDGARFIAEEIRKNVSSLQIPHGKASSPGVVTISLGVAETDATKADSYEEMIKQADAALYSAKEKGRNRIEVFNEIS
jgi:diguanylate cyclase (GGDEF)-like protein